MTLAVKLRVPQPNSARSPPVLRVETLSTERERREMNPVRRYAAAIAAIVTSTAGLMAGSGMFAEGANASSTFTGPLNTISTLASTVPANGDVNPYGVAVVPRSTGNLRQGSVLVS